MKKSMQIAWLFAAIVLFLFPFPLFRLLHGMIDTQNHENRTLAEKPRLALSTMKDYPRDFDNWLNDHLPFKNQLVAWDSLLLLRLFDESPSASVILGKDGWFFYNSINRSDGDAVADFQGTNLFSEEELETIRTNMVMTQKKLAENGIEFILFIAPNKEHVYADKMPDEYGALTSYTRAQQVYDQLSNDIRIVYVAEELARAREQYPQYEFYYRLDTHWNDLGGYIGAKELLKELGQELPDLDQLSIQQNYVPGGDLASMMNLDGYLKASIRYSVSGYSEHAADLVESDSKVARYKTMGQDDRKVLVIRDSFAGAMAPILTSKFDDTLLLHCSSYDKSVLDEEQPDIVVYETVERYLAELINIQIVE